ncbi:hypothetical protein FKM82_030865 [Ascaphus truei]
MKCVDGRSRFVALQPARGIVNQIGSEVSGTTLRVSEDSDSFLSVTTSTRTYLRSGLTPAGNLPRCPPPSRASPRTHRALPMGASVPADALRRRRPRTVGLEGRREMRHRRVTHAQRPRKTSEEELISSSTTSCLFPSGLSLVPAMVTPPLHPLG